MSSRLQLDMRNLSLGRRHLVNAYEVEAGIGVIAGNSVWSMPERLECEVLQKARYINTITLTFTFKAQQFSLIKFHRFHKFHNSNNAEVAIPRSDWLQRQHVMYGARTW